MVSAFWASFLAVSALVFAGTYLAPPWLRWVMGLPGVFAATF